MNAASEFVDDHEPLLDGGSPQVIERVFVQGAKLLQDATPRVVAAARESEAAKRALAAAIRDPATPALKLAALEDQEKRATRVYKGLSAASGRLGDFLERVQARLPK